MAGLPRPRWTGRLSRHGYGFGQDPHGARSFAPQPGKGPVLVIAPPAVLGNWAYEAGRFTPGLTVHIHHGSDRAELSELADVAANTNIILTTYATALRDVARLSNVHWQRVIIDEAQA